MIREHCTITSRDEDCQMDGGASGGYDICSAVIERRHVDIPCCTNTTYDSGILSTEWMTNGFLLDGMVISC